MTAIVRTDRLNKSYGAVTALAGIGFECDAGEVVGVLGLNGAGKSTLLRILAGELLPSGGSVWIGGVELGDDSREMRSRVGYLPEEPPLYREMRVRDYLGFVGALNRVARHELPDRIDVVAGRVHIDGHLDRVIGELSMGYRKRVGIAQALLHEPDVVLLDEPVSSLDPAEIVGMRELVRSLGGRRTVFTSSHHLREVHETCDSILVLHEGELLAHGSQEELGVLASRERIEIEVRGTAVDVAGRLPAGVDVVDSAEFGDDVCTLTLDLAGAEREEVAAALVGAGFGIRRLEPVGSDLERVFLDLVRGDGGAAQAGRPNLTDEGSGS
ncbi:MAG: ABC transporter ATP-binding protein [Holophagales bacterium]|nr:ABC transporter ATP-binding protein [Holophagales bacterium]MYG28997.1 ABC transporter ATP-binding protein [Holophagales bacterium]MYI80683.1 ABC transporter ATP-binding protein [Holophagales bacterium]